MDPLEERILDREICLLADEVTKNDIHYLVNEDSPQSLMAQAQVVMMKVMMEYLMKLEDWSEFESETWDNLDMQKDYYREARAAGDQHRARIYLARVRLLTRLLNRLSDVKRSRLIGLSFPPVPAGESMPRPTLRLLKEEMERRGEWDEETGMIPPASASTPRSSPTE
ncbi:MAG TPA: hypothetical protein VJ550_07805 [Geomonas sp.]|nr:hypothetical protein [Geomonas sp.]